MGLFGAAASYAAFSIVHFFQFVLAVAVCGLYGVELHRTSKGGTTYDGKLVSIELFTILPPPPTNLPLYTNLHPGGEEKKDRHVVSLFY